MDGAGPGTTQETFFVYDGNQIIMQFEGSQATAPDHRYLWGPAVDQIFADEDALNEVLWGLTDNLGTVRDWIDSTGAVEKHIDYDAFGNVTGDTNPALVPLIGYTGRPFDAASGQQNNLNRWYDATIGRWLSEDPIGFAAGDANIQRYVGNSPTRFTDPSGLFSWGDVFRPVAAAGAGLAQGATNIVNGIQDTGVAILNVPAAAVNGIAFIEEQVGILDPKDRVRMPYVPSPDWSRDLITHETDTCHDVSKFAGAAGVETLAGIVILKALKARAAGTALGEAADAVSGIGPDHIFYNEPGFPGGPGLPGAGQPGPIAPGTPGAIGPDHIFYGEPGFPGPASGSGPPLGGSTPGIGGSTTPPNN